MRIVERDEWAAIAASPTPVHVGCILDGNGRWAEMRNEHRTQGHDAGGEALREAIRTSLEVSFETLAVYAFSYQNWNRDPDEVSHLMAFYNWLITEEDLARYERDGVRIEFFGDLDDSRLPQQTLNWIDTCEQRTKHGRALHLVVVFNANDGLLDRAADLPQLDLLIRTGGDARLSSFLPLNTQYAELVFMDTLWPDFRQGHMMSAIHEYQSRSRRFGEAHSFPLLRRNIATLGIHPVSNSW